MDYQGNEIRLGQITGTDRELVISPEDRQTHFYLPGNTGVGKSKMIESMVCQDIDQWMESGCGLMLIDPHGSVYRNVLKHVVESRIDRPIIPLDFSRDDWILGYNPLRDRHGGDPSVIVKTLIAAIAHVFGQKNTEGTPRFGRVGTSVLRALLQHGRTFLEAPHLVSNKSAMAVFSHSVKEHFARTDLRRTASLTDKDFYTEIESTLNRLRPFSQNQRFKAMFGHIGPKQFGLPLLFLFLSLDFLPTLLKFRIWFMFCPCLYEHRRTRLTNSRCGVLRIEVVIKENDLVAVMALIRFRPLVASFSTASCHH